MLLPPLGVGVVLQDFAANLSEQIQTLYPEAIIKNEFTQPGDSDGWEEHLRPGALRSPELSYDAMMLPYTALQGLNAGGLLVDLGGVMGLDSHFQRGDIHPTLLEATLLRGKLLGVPLDGLQLLLYGRADVLAGAGLAMPESWEGLLRAAWRLNGTQAPQLLTTSQPTANSSGPPTDAPGSGPLYGFCLPPSRASLTQVALAVLGSMVQVRGTAQGMYLDRSTLRPAATTAAMPAVLSYLSSLLALGPPGAQFEDPAPHFSNDFALGRCAFTIGVAAQFRRNSHAKHPAGPSFVRGLAWASLLPGSDRVLSGDALVECTADLCPYGTLASHPAVSTATGAIPLHPHWGVGRRALQLERAAPSPLPYAAPTTAPAAASVLVNRAPLLSPLGLLGGVGAGVDLVAQLYSWSMLSAVGGPENSWTLLLAPSSEVGPWRSAHMAAGATAVWEAGGYHPGDTAAFLAACRATLEHPNVVWPLRIRSAPDYLGAMARAMDTLVAGLSALSSRNVAVGTAAMNGLRRTLGGLYPLNAAALGGAARTRRLYAALYCEYLANLGELVEVAPLTATPRRGGSVTLAVSLVAAMVAGTLAATVICHCLMVRASDIRAAWRAVEAPKAGPSTCIAVTDVEGSTSLWEALPEVVMDAALCTHHATVRAASLRHGGYESATEGDSFIIAFASPGAAARFALDLQHSLLAASWPTQLLAVPACRPVFARRLEEVARAAQVSLAPAASPILTYSESAGRSSAAAATAATATGLSAQQSAWRGHSVAVMALANNHPLRRQPPPAKSRRPSLAPLVTAAAGMVSQEAPRERRFSFLLRSPPNGRWGNAASRLGNLAPGRIASFLFSTQHKDLSEHAEGTGHDREMEHGRQQSGSAYPCLAPEHSGLSVLSHIWRSRDQPRPCDAGAVTASLGLRSNRASTTCDEARRSLHSRPSRRFVGDGDARASTDACAQQSGAARDPPQARWSMAKALGASFRRSIAALRGAMLSDTASEQTASASSEGHEEGDGHQQRQQQLGRRRNGFGQSRMRQSRSTASLHQLDKPGNPPDAPLCAVQPRQASMTVPSRAGPWGAHAVGNGAVLGGAAVGAGGVMGGGSGRSPGASMRTARLSFSLKQEDDTGWMLAAARQDLMPASDMAAVANIRGSRAASPSRRAGPCVPHAATEVSRYGHSPVRCEHDLSRLHMSNGRAALEAPADAARAAAARAAAAAALDGHMAISLSALDSCHHEVRSSEPAAKGPVLCHTAGLMRAHVHGGSALRDGSCFGGASDGEHVHGEDVAHHQHRLYMQQPSRSHMQPAAQVAGCAARSAPEGHAAATGPPSPWKPVTAALSTVRAWYAGRSANLSVDGNACQKLMQSRHASGVVKAQDGAAGAQGLEGLPELQAQPRRGRRAARHRSADEPLWPSAVNAELDTEHGIAFSHGRTVDGATELHRRFAQLAAEMGAPAGGGYVGGGFFAMWTSSAKQCPAPHPPPPRSSATSLVSLGTTRTGQAGAIVALEMAAVPPLLHLDAPSGVELPSVRSSYPAPRLPAIKQGEIDYAETTAAVASAGVSEAHHSAELVGVAEPEVSVQIYGCSHGDGGSGSGSFSPAHNNHGVGTQQRRWAQLPLGRHSACIRALPAALAAKSGAACRPPTHGSLLALVHRLFTPVEGPGQSQGPAGEAALLFAGLRVRVGMHCGVTDPRDVQYNSATARITYSGEGLRLAKAVCDCASGGQVVLSGEVLCALQQGGEGGPHGAVLMDLGDHQLFEAQPAHHSQPQSTAPPPRGRGPAPSPPPPALPVSRHLLQLAAPALLGRLRLMPPLRSAIHQFTPGCMDAPVGAVVAVVAIRVVAADALLSWSASAAAESVALLELFLRASLGPLLQPQGQAAAEAAAPGTAPPSTEGQQAAGDSAAAAAPVDSPAVACYLAAAGPGSPFGTFIVGFSRPATAARWALQAAGRMAQLPWPEPLLDSPWGRPLLGVPRAQAEAEAARGPMAPLVPSSVAARMTPDWRRSLESAAQPAPSVASAAAAGVVLDTENCSWMPHSETRHSGDFNEERMGMSHYSDGWVLGGGCTVEGSQAAGGASLNMPAFSAPGGRGRTRQQLPSPLVDQFRTVALRAAADARAIQTAPGWESAPLHEAQKALPKALTQGSQLHDLGCPTTPPAGTAPERALLAGATTPTEKVDGLPSLREGPIFGRTSLEHASGRIRPLRVPTASAGGGMSPPLSRGSSPCRTPPAHQARASCDSQALSLHQECVPLPPQGTPAARRTYMRLLARGSTTPGRRTAASAGPDASPLPLPHAVEHSTESGLNSRRPSSALKKLTASLTLVAQRLQSASQTRRATTARRVGPSSAASRGTDRAPLAGRGGKDADAEDFEPLSLRGLRVRMGLDVGRVRVELCPLTGRLVYGGKTVTAAMTAAAAARLGMLYVTREAAEAMREEEEEAAARYGQMEGQESGAAGLSVAPGSPLAHQGTVSYAAEQGASMAVAVPSPAPGRGFDNAGRLVCTPVPAVMTLGGAVGGAKAPKLCAGNPPLRCRLVEEKLAAQEEAGDAAAFRSFPLQGASRPARHSTSARRVADSAVQ